MLLKELNMESDVWNHVSYDEVIDTFVTMKVRRKLCVCVCVVMPTHCTITHFGFCATRINGIECGLFSNHAPLGQTIFHVGRISV